MFVLSGIASSFQVSVHLDVHVGEVVAMASGVAPHLVDVLINHILPTPAALFANYYHSFAR
jgi:hypothetical protein